jgi:hypothetical protein
MTPESESTRAVLNRYGGIATAYDRLHARWLRHAGGEAQSAFEGAVIALVRPGVRILDADRVRRLPCRGPAAVMMIDKPGDVPSEIVLR